jgi:hypothetical protein
MVYDKAACKMGNRLGSCGALLAAQIAYRQPKSETRAAIIAYLKELN